MKYELVLVVVWTTLVASSVGQGAPNITCYDCFEKYTPPYNTGNCYNNPTTTASTCVGTLCVKTVHRNNGDQVIGIERGCVISKFLQREECNFVNSDWDTAGQLRGIGCRCVSNMCNSASSIYLSHLAIAVTFTLALWCRVYWV